MGRDDDWSDDPFVWVVRDANGSERKPATVAQIIQGLATGELSHDMIVRHVRLSQWERMGAFMTRVAPGALPLPSTPSVASIDDAATRSTPAAQGGTAMRVIDRIEKVGRALLWLSIASAFIVAPVEYVRLHAAEAEALDALRRTEEQAKAEAEKAERVEKAAHDPQRMAFASMGGYMSALVPSATGEQGKLWLTNVSPRRGVLCVYGVATSRATKRTSTSMPTCVSIADYAAAHLSLMFAGGELLDVCPKQGDCDMTIHDAPEPKEVPLAFQ